MRVDYVGFKRKHVINCGTWLIVSLTRCRWQGISWSTVPWSDATKPQAITKYQSSSWHVENVIFNWQLFKPNILKTNFDMKPTPWRVFGTSRKERPYVPSNEICIFLLSIPMVPTRNQHPYLRHPLKAASLFFSNTYRKLTTTSDWNRYAHVRHSSISSRFSAVSAMLRGVTTARAMPQRPIAAMQLGVWICKDSRLRKDSEERATKTAVCMALQTPFAFRGRYVTPPFNAVLSWFYHAPFCGVVGMKKNTM